jgi:spore germination protein PC
MYPDYNHQQLICHLQWQADRLIHLENAIQKLQLDIQAIKDMKQNHIDKIEYNFDLLKIEKLEGTLNIGITPAGGKNIEDISVDGQVIDGIPAQADNRLFAPIQKKVNDYLDNELPAEICGFEREFSNKLEVTQYPIIVEDIRKQVDDRIRYYVEKNHISELPGSEESSINQITEKIKNDIRLGLNQYIRKFFGREGETQ